MGLLDYSGLRDIQKREIETSALVPLPEDFYRVLSQLMVQKKSDAFSSKSLLSIKEYENMRKIVIAIQAKREEKIMLMALRGENSGEGLTIEEKQMLKELSSIINTARQNIIISWDNDNVIPSDSLRIRILQDVAQYKGVDNAVYGPFKPGQEEMLPKSEAQWLVSTKLAELI